MNYLVGEFDIIFQTLLILVLSNYILGVITVKVNKELNSQKGTVELVKNRNLSILYS
ncbi:phage holin family protein [Clostridium sp. UBA2485]|uniref:phage holin family protein n=1 Tax=Clostridium sp. UBA2485 TaxID=1946352 RepID=UPI0039C8A006